MDTAKLSTAAGWIVAAILAGYLFFDRLSKPLPPPGPPAAVVATPPAPAATIAPEPSPIASRTPSVLEILNSRFPATAAGHAPPPAPTTVILPDPALRVTEPAPIAPASQAAPAPTRSGMDAERDKAAVLIPTLERMEASVQELASLDAEWQKLCVGVIEMPYVDPYGNRIPGTMEREKTPECLSRKARMNEIRTALPRDSADVQEVARRAGVIPGVLRELTAKYGLSAYLRP